LDPDEDFLKEAQSLGDERLRVIAELHSRSNPHNLEDLILKHYPDVVVLNLDVDHVLGFGRSVQEILNVPLALPPIVVGTTSREGSDLRAKAYAVGVDDYLVRPFGLRDLGFRLGVLRKTRRLQKHLEQATRKLSGLNLQLSDSNRRLEEMTVTDELTGLSNMRFMTQFLEKQFQMLSRYERPFALLMIDLDHFKSVNDKNDHLVGSQTIRTIGRTIDACTRTSDVKARYGGDEYVVAMPETDGASAEFVANRLREAIAESVHTGHDGAEFRVTASIGVASFAKDRHTSYRDLVKEADRAMYLSKKNGRNRVTLWRPESTSELQEYDETQSAIMTEIKKISGKE